MNVAKITISLENELLKKLDSLVKSKIFPNRSQAIQIAVAEKVEQFNKHRFAMECEKLDIAEEQAMADEGLAFEVNEWQPY